MESLQQVTSSGTNLAMPEDGAGQGSSNEGRGRIRSGTGTPLGLRIGSLFLSWAEVSDINFLSDSQIQQICQYLPISYVYFT